MRFYFGHAKGSIFPFGFPVMSRLKILYPVKILKTH